MPAKNRARFEQPALVIKSFVCVSKQEEDSIPKPKKSKVTRQNVEANFVTISKVKITAER